MGVVAGYLRWSGMVPDGPQAITVVEQILRRQMGPAGRELVALAPNLAGPRGLSPMGRLALQLRGAAGRRHPRRAARGAPAGPALRGRPRHRADLRPAGLSDDLADTIDYGAVSEAVAASDRRGPRRPAGAPGRAHRRHGPRLWPDPRARSVTVTVRKLRPPVPVDLASAAVRITRP